MLKSIDSCSICWEPISNPVCVSCYIKQIDIWMSDNDISPKKRNFIIRKIKRRIPKIRNFENTKCILCKNQRIVICSYCLFLISARILVNENFPARLIEDFLQTFNYQLGHEDYPIGMNVY